jgi:hypothetical protein
LEKIPIPSPSDFPADYRQRGLLGGGIVNCKYMDNWLTVWASKLLNKIYLFQFMIVRNSTGIMSIVVFFKGNGKLPNCIRLRLIWL